MNVEVLLFFFKQKTAYEMRISDWSSDVCSSDLLNGGSEWHGLTILKMMTPMRAAWPPRPWRTEADPGCRRPIGLPDWPPGGRTTVRQQHLLSRMSRRGRTMTISAQEASFGQRAATWHVEMHRRSKDRKSTRLNSSHYCAS